MFSFFKTIIKAWRYKQLHKVMDRQKEILEQESKILDKVNETLANIERKKGSKESIELFEDCMRQANNIQKETATEYRKLEARKKRLLKIS